MEMELGAAARIPGIITATCFYFGNAFELFGGKNVECKREYESLSSERDSPMYLQTKPNRT